MENQQQNYEYFHNGYNQQHPTSIGINIHQQQQPYFQEQFQRQYGAPVYPIRGYVLPAGQHYMQQQHGIVYHNQQHQHPSSEYLGQHHQQYPTGYHMQPHFGHIRPQQFAATGFNRIVQPNVGPIQQAAQHRVRRPRITFSPYQKSILRQEFKVRQFIEKERREELAMILEVPPEKIGTWFQNQRALGARSKNHLGSCSTSSEKSDLESCSSGEKAPSLLAANLEDSPGSSTGAVGSDVLDARQEDIIGDEIEKLAAVMMKELLDTADPDNLDVPTNQGSPALVGANEEYSLWDDLGLIDI